MYSQIAKNNPGSGYVGEEGTAAMRGRSGIRHSCGFGKVKFWMMVEQVNWKVRMNICQTFSVFNFL